ncbi:ornithine carbamoyltransferase [Halorhodospira sp. 9621]|uniref:ornithine carbamoyltransferase n=1 Tax=Halorhodospira TaxID=85108 RepID=UPI001EE81201|nr:MULTISPECIES: ornithine carbamoyltransferase [Halorhodospira]MCG5528505.1 ornithine carbamoyltransferase [Halorhodospira halophila]MCG5534127.1 ornithine carbamoyltransferase [Halorhodospira sp. 9621]MCG5543832.1 ornithine carbamoyltransferase [Halorhodospira sp. 9628]
MRHFLTLRDCSADEIHQLLRRATELRDMHRAGQLHQPLQGRVLGMVFEKSSTRTRVSFEAGMAQLGGHALFLSPRDTQLGRGEPVEDTARVISRMVDAVMIRTFGHDMLERFAAYSAAPVINGLSDLCHPCQLLADLQTFTEHRGPITDRRVAWIGDGNNMCHSWIEAAGLLGFDLHIAAPPGYRPEADILALGGERVQLFDDAYAAAEGADLVTTDVWASMGQESEQAAREEAFRGFCVTESLMECAGPEALFMHCLPAHRGEEVEAAVLEGPQSVVWDEAENRLHAQKALLEFLMLPPENGPLHPAD